MIRPASLADVPALTALEDACFETDRLSARSFRHLLSKGNAATLVADGAGEIGSGALDGYALVLFHRNTSLARLYSLAVAPDRRGRGLGRALLEAAETTALARGAATMRLEVRRDDAHAIALYERAGYRPFGTHADYYEDHMDALRLEKGLVPNLAPDRGRVPFYAQSLEFTCGPAALMMAMKALKPRMRLSRTLELRLWREATTIFMTAGHGGCGPYGLAVSALERGFSVAVHASAGPDLFTDGVRAPDKRRVIRLVQEDFLRELAEAGVAVDEALPDLAALRAAFEAGAVPVVLISAYRLTGVRQPHWVTVTAIDDAYVYLNDPDVDEPGSEPRGHRAPTDCIGIPVPHADFERMRRIGRAKDHAAVFIRRKDTSA